MKELFQTLTIPVLALICANLAQGQVGDAPQLLPINRALGKDFWSNPEFRRSFIGDYGFRSQIEPRIDRKEQELLRKVISQAQADPSLAIAALEKNIKPDSSAALDFTLATLRFEKGELAQAEKGYKVAIGKLPSFLRAHKNLGLVLLQQEEFAQAADALIKAISHGENEGVTFVALGYCYLMLEKYASAENAYRAAILRNPEAMDAQNGLVNCLLETSRHAEAAAMLEELIAKYPEQSFYWRAQTNAYVQLDKPLGAALNLETLRRMGELDVRGHLLLGDLYHNLELSDLALLVYRKALALQGDLEAGRFIRVASILVDRGSYEEGFEYLDRIQAKFDQGLEEKDRLDLLGLRARIAFARGEQAEADSYLAAILETNPNNGQALLLRGRYFWKKKNDPIEATFYFERAAKVDDTARDALVEHAQMLVAQEKYSAAVKMLERAQLLEPRENVERYLDSVRNVMRVKGKER